MYEVTSFTLLKHGLDSDISIALDDDGENFIVDTADIATTTPTTTDTNDDDDDYNVAVDDDEEEEDDDDDEKKTESFEKENDNNKEGSNNNNTSLKDLSPEEYDKRHHMKKHELYRDTKNARYAIKHIKESYCKEHDSKSYIQAAR